MTTTTRTTTSAEHAGPPRAAASLHVAPASTADTAAWARYVEQAPLGTLYHHPDWSAAVTATFGHRPCHLLARRGSRVVGVLPLLEVNSPLAGRLLLSVPYGNAGGLLFDDAAARDALVTAAVHLTHQRRARTLELRSPRADVPGFDRVDGYLGFSRPLPLHPNEMDHFLPRKARAAARHARARDGLTVQHDPRLMPLVWRLYTRSMRRLGSLNYPRRFFTALFDRLGDRAWATVVWAGECPVAGTLSFVFRDTVLPYIVGVDERVRSEGATNLLYWSVAERAVRSSLRRFDFGRSRSDNPGSANFKKNQGFAPRPLGYQRYLPPGRPAPDLQPTSPRYALARRLWPHLPLPVTRTLGAWLSRALPG